MNTSISKLEHNNTAALITGEGTTLTITGNSSSYGGSFGGTVTVDYTGGRDLHPGQFQQGYGAYARVLS